MTEKFSKSQTVLRSAALLTGSALLLQLLGFAYRILLSRLLTAEQMGVYGILMPIYALLSAGTLSGFSLAAARTTADFVGRREALISHAGKTVKSALKMYALCFCIAALLFSMGVKPIAAWVGEDGLQIALLLLLPCLLMTALENILKSVFQGIANVTPSMISECTEQLVRIAAVGILLFFAKPQSDAAACTAIVIGMIVSEAASDIILCGFAKGSLPLDGKQDAALEKQILRTALPVCGGNACSVLLSGAAGVMIPAALQKSGYSQSVALSVYGELSGMLLPLLSFPGAFIYPIHTVMLPRLTAAFASGKRGLLQGRVRKTLLVTAVLALFGEGTAVLFASALCKLCFGKENPAGIEQILLLGGMTFLGLFIAGEGCVLNAMKKQHFLVLSGILLGIVELPVLGLCTVRYGLSGYAAVSFGMNLLQAIIWGQKIRNITNDNKIYN